MKKVYCRIKKYCNRMKLKYRMRRNASQPSYQNTEVTELTDAREYLYFRISSFYSYIDTVLSQLDGIFLGHQQQALCISWSLLPSRRCSVTFEDNIRPAITFYARHLDRPLEVELEFGLWQSKWSNYTACKTNPSPSTLTEALAYCSNQPTLTNIRTLLLIFAAISVTSDSI